MKNKMLFSVLRIFLFCNLFLLGNSAFARIEIENLIRNSDFRTCDGSFDLVIEADEEHLGLAQPFDITIDYIGRGDFSIPPILDYKGDSPIPTFENLCQGNYIITVVNAYGCETTITVDMISCQQTLPNIKIVEMQNPDLPTSNTGLIKVEASREGDFTFEWSNGETGPMISNLSGGIYTVTLSNGQCEISKEIELGTCQVKKCIDTPDDCDCCEFVFVDNPEIPDFEITTTGGINFTNAETMNLEVLFKEEGNSQYSSNFSENYTFEWLTPNGDVLGNNPQQLLTGDKPSWVRVSVFNGCDKKEEIVRIITCDTNDEYSLMETFIKNEYLPCEGFNDGSFDIQLPKLPDGISYSATLDDIIPVFFIEQGELIIGAINSLAPNVEYNLKINIGECEFDFNFSLDAEPKERRLLKDEFDFDEEICRYEEFCRDNFIAIEEEQATYNYRLGDQGGFKCVVPLFCGGSINMGDKRIRRRKVTVFEYRQILQAGLGLNAIDFDFVEEQERKLIGKNACKELRYCPGNFEFYRFTSPFKDLPGREGDFQILDNGCAALICGIVPKFVVCPGDEIDIPGQEVNPEVDFCFPNTINLFQLFIYWKNGYLSGLPGFTGSPLEIELERLELFELDNRMKCASITYCRVGFDNISTNLNDVDCSGDPPNNYSEFKKFCEIESVNINGTIINSALCKRGAINEYEPYVVTFRPNPSGNVFRSLQDSLQSLSPKIISDKFGKEILDRFWYSSYDGLKIPKGLIKADSINLFYDYEHNSLNIDKSDDVNVKFYLDDWDSESTTFVEELLLNKKYILEFVDSVSFFNKIISSDSIITPLHLSNNLSEITITGYFIDSLNYDTINITESNSLSSFLIKTDLSGNLLSNTIIENLDTTLIFSENQNGEILLASPYQGDSIIINGATQNMSIPDGLMVAGIDANNEVKIRQTYPNLDSMQLLDIAYATGGTQYTVALGNMSLSITRGDAPMPIGQELDNQEKQIVLMTYDASDNLLHRQTIPMSNVNTDKFDLIYGEGRDLLVGLTFEDTLTFRGVNLISSGQEDIALLKIDSLGNLEWHRTYGTTDNENVSQLMYDNTVVFFGGEFNGSTQTRDIGNYRFVNLTNSYQRAYISYVFDEVSGNYAAEDRTQPVEPPVTRPITSEVKVFPNPFNKSFTVSFDAVQLGNTKIIVTDMMGKEVYTKNHDTQIGTNEIIINNLENATGGVYYISVHREAENRQSSHKIIHIK